MGSTRFRVASVVRVLVVMGLIGSAFGFQSVPNLVLYYKLDEAAGTSSADSGGGGFTGTWTNVTVAAVTCVSASVAGDCAPLVAGNSRSIVLTKPATVTTNGGYVNVPSDPSFSFAGPFTAMAWIKPSAFLAGDNPNDTGAIIQKWDWTGVETNGYGMNRNLNGTIAFWMGKAAMGNTILTTTAATPLDDWSHVAIVFTGAGRQIYINGGLSASDTYAILGASTAPLHIGKDDWARNFYGNVDEVRLYGRALAAGEIQSIVAGGNTMIGVNNPGPVIPQRGLLAQYYNDTAAIGAGNTPPGSAQATPSATATLALTRIDPQINFNWGNGSPDPAVTVDQFYGVWTGKITTTSAGGSYGFGTISDDGIRVWVNNTLVVNNYILQGPSANPIMGTAINLTANTTYPIRVEFMENGGGAVSELFWQPTGAAAASVVPVYALQPPDGPATPTNLTAVGSTTSGVPSVAVSWNATATPPITGISYILSRATAAGGPYTQVAVQTGTTFTDNGVVFGTGYFYEIQATDMNGLLVGAPSAPVGPATPVLPPITASPLSVTTSEAGGNATITLTINTAPSAAGTITITSSNANQALVSGQGNGNAGVQGPAASIVININSGTVAGTTIPITVYGVDDFIAQATNQTYTISFTVGAGGGTWTGATIPTVNGTNIETDVAGILVNPGSGLVTTTNGGTAAFAVQLSSKPASGSVSVTVTSSNTTEGVVTTPMPLTFTGANWNQPQAVIVTGQGVNLTYLNTPYTVTVAVGAGSDAAYLGMTRVVFLTNIHLEVPPALPHVWNGSGGGGGCGLTGLETLLLLGAAAAWRRRRRR